MWNHQKLLILFFCIATVFVQSSRAALEEWQDKLVADLKRILGKHFVPEGHINYFLHWRSWEKIEDSFKWTVADNYIKSYETYANLPENRGEIIENVGKKLAYKALDRQAKLFEEIIEAELRLGGAENLVTKLEDILNGGQFLHFLAFIRGKYSKSEPGIYLNTFEQYLQDDFGLSEAIFEERIKEKLRKGKHNELLKKFEKILNLGYSLQFRQFLVEILGVNVESLETFQPFMVNMYLSHFEITL